MSCLNNSLVYSCDPGFSTNKVGKTKQNRVTSSNYYFFFLVKTTQNSSEFHCITDRCLFRFHTAVFLVDTATKSGTYLCTESMLPKWPSLGIIFVGEGSPEFTDVVAVVFPEVDP
jgi:hypothetical protein